MYTVEQRLVALRRHWPCLLPHHGPGRKHERELGMARWQWQIVSGEAFAFLRGLLHSDGCRVDNWATQIVAGKVKRYAYGRWEFTNAPPEIRKWCCEALDLVGISRRQPAERVIAVSRREGVALLDERIGPKR